MKKRDNLQLADGRGGRERSQIIRRRGSLVLYKSISRINTLYTGVSSAPREGGMLCIPTSIVNYLFTWGWGRERRAWGIKT
jgi:hypothetical protein